MNENQYIHALFGALLGMEPAERETILADYRQHFSDGRAQGISDETIAASLGEPEAVAAAYLEEWSGKRSVSIPPERLQPWWRRVWLPALLIIIAVVIVVVIRFGGHPSGTPGASDALATEGPPGVNISLPGVSLKVDGSGNADVDMGDGIHFEGNMDRMLDSLDSLGTRTVNIGELKNLPIERAS